MYSTGQPEIYSSARTNQLRGASVLLLYNFECARNSRARPATIIRRSPESLSVRAPSPLLSLLSLSLLSLPALSRPQDSELDQAGIAPEVH